MTTETAEEMKQERNRNGDSGWSEGSHVTAVNERAKGNEKGHSVGYTVASGKHYEKVKQA